jgi:two-component system NtrC family response regulator
MAKEDLKALLVVEDDAGLQNQLRWSFENYEVAMAGDRDAALAHVRRFEPRVVTLDLGLPPDPANASEGLATLQEILQVAPHTKVIVVTGNDDRENALKAIALGAYDYYQKPIDPQILGLIIDRAYHVYELEEENRRLHDRPDDTPLGGIIGISPKMLRVTRTIEKIAPTDATTLIIGESGTGKELVARALHALSPRASSKFVAINCAAIPENLLESELFGYEKGAFTGAVKQTRGKIEFADHGTFFLDEVGDLPAALQPKILRFLQERVIERVGGREELPVDVRVICATHCDLPKLIQEGRFREDLYYRISEITINVPPLREREGDVVVLARTLFDRYRKDHKRTGLRGFTQEALRAIEKYQWPGNVRELENKVKRAVIMAEGSKITPEDLDIEAANDAGVPWVNLRQVRDEAERQAVQRALSLCNGNVSQAAELLGISRPTLYDLMSKFAIK